MIGKRVAPVLIRRRFGHCRANTRLVTKSNKNQAYEELAMSIQKKSLISSLNATKKAIVASSTAPAQVNPTVNAPISARVMPRVRGRVAAQVTARVAAKVTARKK
jgi:hypothetical protein